MAYPQSRREADQSTAMPMSKKIRAKKAKPLVSPLSPLAHFLAVGFPVAGLKRPSPRSPTASLTEQDRKSILSSALALKRLGFEPADLFSNEVRAEAACRVWRENEGLDEASLLVKLAGGNPSDALDAPDTVEAYDALDAPSTRLYLKALREQRSRNPDEKRPGELDRCADALRLSRKRGTQVKPFTYQIVLFCDYWTYMTLRKEFAERTETRFGPSADPELIDFTIKNFYEIEIGARRAALLPDETTLLDRMEAALKRQVDAYDRAKSLALHPPRRLPQDPPTRLKPTQRVALAFYETKTGQEATEQDVDEALKMVGAIRRAVGLIADRANLKPSKT